MASIKQKAKNSMQENSTQTAPAHNSNGAVSGRAMMRLPDFRNLGICLRTLVIVNLVALFAAILQSRGFIDTLKQMAELSVFTQPVLLLSFLLLFAAAPRLIKLPYYAGVAAVIAISLVATTAIYQFGSYVFPADELPGLARNWLLSAITPPSCCITFTCAIVHSRQPLQKPGCRLCRRASAPISCLTASTPFYR